jgi:hypothetical protein
MRQRFADEDVQNVPEVSGIFKLYHEADLVYIGRTPPSSGLRNELEHALRMAAAEDMEVTHFTFELTKSPKTRAAEELRSYFENWGRLPQYNRPQGAAFQQRVELRR